MKTKITFITLLFLASFNGFAQIDRNYKSQVKLKDNYVGKKIPLLIATDRDIYDKKVLEDLKKIKIPPKTDAIIAELVPIPLTNYKYSLDVTLTSNLLKTSVAGLYFSGAYKDGKIYVEQVGNPWVGHLGAYFDAKRNKTYLIKLKFDLSYREYCKYPLSLNVHTNDKKTVFPLKKGANSLEFLIQSKTEGKINFSVFHYWMTLCGGRIFDDERLKYEFTSLQIQELKN